MPGNPAPTRQHARRKIGNHSVADFHQLFKKFFPFRLFQIQRATLHAAVGEIELPHIDILDGILGQFNHRWASSRCLVSTLITSAPISASTAPIQDRPRPRSKQQPLNLSVEQYPYLFPALHSVDYKFKIGCFISHRLLSACPDRFWYIPSVCNRFLRYAGPKAARQPGLPLNLRKAVRHAWKSQFSGLRAVDIDEKFTSFHLFIFQHLCGITHSAERDTFFLAVAIDFFDGMLHCPFQHQRLQRVPVLGTYLALANNSLSAQSGCPITSTKRRH